MSKTINIFKAMQQGELRQIALSEADLVAACPDCTSPGWSIKSVSTSVVDARGWAVNWAEHIADGCEYDHVHCKCLLCGEQHDTDLEAGESNPALWFCERGRGLCLVAWQRATAQEVQSYLDGRGFCSG